jgi:hypothetical protein
LLALIEIWAEAVGEAASNFLDSDSAAKAALCITYLIMGLLIGYSLAKGVL